MIKGVTVFRCAECKKVFIGLAIELCATSMIAPLKCKRCGSSHTYPLFGNKLVYKKIWEQLDKE